MIVGCLSDGEDAQVAESMLQRDANRKACLVINGPMHDGLAVQAGKEIIHSGLTLLKDYLTLQTLQSVAP